MSQNEMQERFVALETKVAFQEKLLSELSDVLAEQTKQLASLERRIVSAERAVREGKEDEQALPHERPPHY